MGCALFRRRQTQLGRCGNAGLLGRVDGFVATQSPAAGSPLDLVGAIDLRLEREPSVPAEAADSPATP